MSFFISEAMAEGAAAGQQAGGDAMFQMLLPIGLIILLYFLMIRPQVKRQKEHGKLVEALTKGDEVQTEGGMLGKITHLTDDVAKIEIADGVEIKVRRQSVAAVLPKGTIADL
jgi:preprotein translocase subunit YajC